MWRAYAVSALRYPWTFVTPQVEAAAIWIPPGGTELTAGEARRLGELIEKAAGQQAAASAREIEARFEAALPAGPFFHLTILATHASHRSKGLGMGLLAGTSPASTPWAPPRTWNPPTRPITGGTIAPASHPAPRSPCPPATSSRPCGARPADSTAARAWQLCPAMR